MVILVSLLLTALLNAADKHADRTREALARRPRALIEKASDGSVCVNGRVRRRVQPIKAPVSGRPCMAFHLLIERRSGRIWAPLLELQGVAPFVIADESGEALVDTSGPCKLMLAPDEHGRVGWFDRPSPARLQALKSLLRLKTTVDVSGLGVWWSLRYKEGILQEGETVTVGGRGTREVNPEGRSVNLRQPPQRLVLRGTAEELLLISHSSGAITDRAFR